MWQLGTLLAILHLVLRERLGCSRCARSPTFMLHVAVETIFVPEGSQTARLRGPQRYSPCQGFCSVYGTSAAPTDRHGIAAKPLAIDASCSWENHATTSVVSAKSLRWWTIPEHFLTSLLSQPCQSNHVPSLEIESDLSEDYELLSAPATDSFQSAYQQCPAALLNHVLHIGAE